MIKKLIAALRAARRSEAAIARLEKRVTDLSAEVRLLRVAKAAAPAAAAAPKPAGKPPTTLAIVGARGHGTKNLQAFLKLTGCKIAYICDVDSDVANTAANAVKTAKGYRPKTVADLRDVLADPALDGVVICTPHHWHALMAVWALRAGKHVYLEKPVTHNFGEGASLLAAAQKYKKVFQAGTQLRSNASLQAAGDYMRAGKLGDVTLVHCLIHKDRPPLPLSNDNSIPASVNYDLWLGPRQEEPLTRSKFHYHWHWFWTFGNGALGNNGIHRIDAARIALDLKGRGDMVLSIGGRFGPQDPSQTPNTQLCLHKFGKVWVLQDILGLQPKSYRGITNGLVFHGTKGVIVYKAGVATLCDLAFKPISVFEGGQKSHQQNFLDAIRSNDPAIATGKLDEAILSGDLCHFGNISHRLGAPADDATIRADLTALGVPALVLARLTAMRENIRAAGNGDAALTLGHMLRLQDGPDPFIDPPQGAADLLHVPDRAPYNLPGPDAV